MVLGQALASDTSLGRSGAGAAPGGQWPEYATLSLLRRLDGIMFTLCALLEESDECDPDADQEEEDDSPAQRAAQLPHARGGADTSRILYQTTAQCTNILYQLISQRAASETGGEPHVPPWLLDGVATLWVCAPSALRATVGACLSRAGC